MGVHAMRRCVWHLVGIGRGTVRWGRALRGDGRSCDGAGLVGYYWGLSEGEGCRVVLGVSVRWVLLGGRIWRGFGV